MVIKIMTRVICNKIIIMVNIQQWNSMTGISRSNKRLMQDKSMTRDILLRIIQWQLVLSIKLRIQLTKL